MSSQVPVIQPFVVAVENKQWTMLAALTVAALVALSKQGWFSAWIADKLNTPLKTQLYALALGMGAAFSVDVLAGKNAVTAIEDAINIVILAVFTHQFVIKGILKGREPISPTKKVAETRALDAQIRATLAGSASSRPPPPSGKPSEVVTIPSPPSTPRNVGDDLRSAVQIKEK